MEYQRSKLDLELERLNASDSERKRSWDYYPLDKLFHDIRNPLAVILSYAQLLKDEQLVKKIGAKKVADIFLEIEESGYRIETLISHYNRD